MMSGARQKFNN